MSFRDFEYWPNGEIVYQLISRTCDKCGKYIAPNGDWHSVNDCDYCTDCAFLLGIIDAKKYATIAVHYSEPPGMKVEIHKGKIYQYRGNIKPWEKPDRDYRKTAEYKNWRSSVFQRDMFTCTRCHSKKERIEAHHVLRFHTHFNERFNVDNGLTLCVPCHKKEHGKRT